MQQALLAGYYNAMMMYLTVANETLADDGNLTDGIGLVRRMKNRTFSGEYVGHSIKFLVWKVGANELIVTATGGSGPCPTAIEQPIA